MDTNELIKTLAADTRRPASAAFVRVVGGRSASRLQLPQLFSLRCSVRGPILQRPLETPRFLFKFLVTITLAVSAFGCVRALSRPGESWRNAVLCLAVAPALIAMAVIVELFTLPSDSWSATLIGTNSIACLTYIPLIGIGPLAIFLWPCAMARRPDPPSRARSRGCLPVVSRLPFMPPNAPTIPRYLLPPGTRSR